MKKNIQVIERKQTKNTFRPRNFSHLVVSAPTTTKKNEKKNTQTKEPPPYTPNPRNKKTKKN